VIEIDQRTIGSGSPGPLTRKLQDLYFAACKGEDDRYASWLTPIT
jgi:branched-chain amino acid aminotransferase